MILHCSKYKIIGAESLAPNCKSDSRNPASITEDLLPFHYYSLCCGLGAWCLVQSKFYFVVKKGRIWIKFYFLLRSDLDPVFLVRRIRARGFLTVGSESGVSLTVGSGLFRWLDLDPDILNLDPLSCIEFFLLYSKIKSLKRVQHTIFFGYFRNISNFS